MDVFWIQKKYIIQLLKLSITIFGDQEQQSITIVANSQQLSGVGCWSGWICGQVQDGCLVLFLLAKLKNWSKGLHNAHREIHGSPSSCATRGCAVWRGSWSCPSTTAASAGPEHRLHFLVVSSQPGLHKPTADTLACPGLGEVPAAVGREQLSGSVQSGQLGDTATRPLYGNWWFSAPFRSFILPHVPIPDLCPAECPVPSLSACNLWRGGYWNCTVVVP